MADLPTESVQRLLTQRIRQVLFLVALALIVTATLSPEREGLRPTADLSDRVSSLVTAAGVPTGWGPLGFQFFANIVLFVPLGAAFAGIVSRQCRWLGFLLIPLLSVGVETAQYLLLPNRAAEAADIVANSVGGWIGIGLVLLWHRCFGRRAAEARRQRFVSGGQVSPSVDAVAWAFAVGFTGLVAVMWAPVPGPGWAVLTVWGLVAALQWLLGRYLLVYPTRGKTVQLSAPQLLISAVVSTVSAGVLAWLVTLFLRTPFPVPRSFLLIALPIAAVTAVAGRYVLAFWRALEDAGDGSLR